MSQLDQFQKSLSIHSEALDYLRDRGVTRDEISRYCLGWNDDVSLTFTGIVFPVHDPYSRVVGYFSRWLDDGGYSVQREFSCHDYVYSLHLNYNEIISNGYVVVVEGAFDVFSIQRLGIPAVALMGSLISKRQLAILSRYTQRVVVALDEDAESKNEISLLCNRLSKFGVETVVIRDHYCEGDPDLFIRRGGGEKFRDSVLAKI